VSFTDYGWPMMVGNGPLNDPDYLRRGNIAVFDLDRQTSDQARGPINFHIHEGAM